MRISVPIALALMSFGIAGCSSDAVDPYQQAADEVTRAAAALDEESTDDTALDGLAESDAAVVDTDDDADEAAEEAAAGDGGVRDGHHHRGHHGRGRHRHGRRHGGHGAGLLLWYADLEALQVCRDQREACAASADPSLCEDDVHACVRGVLEQAFAAMCEEKLAMCEAADAPERACGRIERVCGGGDEPAADAGTTPDPTPTPDAG